MHFRFQILGLRSRKRNLCIIVCGLEKRYGFVIRFRKTMIANETHFVAETAVR